MKNRLKRGVFASVCLALLLCSLCGTAFALEYSVAAGTQRSISFGVMTEADFSYYVTGEVPGMALAFEEGYAVLSGIPTQTGGYTVTLLCVAPDGTQTEVNMSVTVTEAIATQPTEAPAPGPQPVVTKDPTAETVVEGESAIFVARADNALQYEWELLTPDGQTILCGDLPVSVEFIRVTGDTTETLTLSNIPYVLNGSKIRCAFLTEDACVYSAYALLTVIDGDAVPVVTKDPTGETVNEGNLAQFVARADNATGYEWKIMSPDGKTTYSCHGLQSVFPGIRVTGADTECLTIYDIPADMDGWRVYCVFSAPGGETSSTRAVIQVNAKPTQPTETTAPPTTEPPTQPVTEPPTEPPTEQPTQPPTQTTQPQTQSTEPSAPPQTTRPSGSGKVKAVLMGILFGAIFAAVVAGGVFVYLRIRKRDAEFEEYEEDAEFTEDGDYIE